jgi:hypothetical protein
LLIGYDMLRLASLAVDFLVLSFLVVFLTVAFSEAGFLAVEDLLQFADQFLFFFGESDLLEKGANCSKNF